MKLRIYILIFLWLNIYSAARSQNVSNEDSVYTFTEVMPEFPGGKEKLMQYVTPKLYLPVNCSKDNLTTRINVSFVVDVTGKVKDVTFKEKITCPDFEKTISEIFLSMPLWTPGEQDGEAVNVRMFYPLIIEFE